MARKYQGGTKSGYTVLVIDDSIDVMESSRRLLEAEGHRVLTASDGPSGLELFDRERVHLVLVDYFMPGMTGEEVVRLIRERNRLVQIILVTGYSGEKPARVMMRQLDIQGYHDKSEGAEHLLLWVDAALKAYLHVLAMEKHRTGLRYLLDITPDLHRLQPVDELLQGLLWQIEGLLGAENSFVATLLPDAVEPLDQSEGFVALVEDQDAHRSLSIRFGTGRFEGSLAVEALEPSEAELVQTAVRSGEIHIHHGASVVPLRFGKRTIGVIYLDRHRGDQRDSELLEVFANQAAAAIQNSLLYDLATVDPLSGVYVRGFAVLQLQQTIKRAMRRGEPLSLLMVDLDKFKQVNDTYGHPMGDRVIAAVGALLRDAVRETDVVGRYGGDEFMVILPDTPSAGALVAASRLLERAATVAVREEGVEIPVRLSVGVGTLHVGEANAETIIDNDALLLAAEGLIESADRALYSAKGTGHAGGRLPLRWEEMVAQAMA